MAETKTPAKPATDTSAAATPRAATDTRAASDARTASGTRTEDVIVRARVPNQSDGDAKKGPRTGSDTYRATQRGYAINPDNGAGVIVEQGEMVPADQPVSELWMEKVNAKDRKLAAAVEEGLDLKPKDVDYTQASLPALQALAMLYNMNVGDLGKADLITAIKAHREKDAG